MHQSAEEGGRQRCSSISSNHHEKNGWDEHRPVIFRKPTHLHTENEGWPRRRRGEGDLNRRRVGRAHRPRAGGPPLAAPTPACVPSLGRPVKAIPSVGDFVKNKADNFFLDKCRMANPVKRATVRPCSEKGTTGPVKRRTNQPTNLLRKPCTRSVLL